MTIFPTRILLATDGSEEAQLALDTATDLAQKTDSELHIVHVWPVVRLYSNVDSALVGSVEGHKESRQAAQELLDEQVHEAEKAGAKVAGSHVEEGDPDREIVRLAEELGVGLIMVGSRGVGGIRRALMGSVSDSVVRHAHCPVMVVRG
ncbi:MAG TPA: universal stress protein [Rubrobacteraceae bacterium]|nr:universal stress protein [Rubrobacteraceae bacterium]